MSASPTHRAKAKPAPSGGADPLDALLLRAIESAPDGPARAWLRRLLARGECASGQDSSATPRAPSSTSAPS